MLQNPEIKKKEKYHLRPRFAIAGSSARSAPASGGGILTWAGIVPALTGDSVCTRIIRFVGASGRTRRNARSSLSDSYRVQAEVTRCHGNESHRPRQAAEKPRRQKTEYMRFANQQEVTNEPWVGGLDCWRRAGEEILAFGLRRGTLPCRHSRWWRKLRTGFRRP